MPVDNTSVVNVNDISPSRAKDTKISRAIFFLSFYRGICFIDIQNNIFSSAPHGKKVENQITINIFAFFVQIHAHYIIVVMLEINNLLQISSPGSSD